jgi:protein-S-isoprenylcysteine O-methyltransferase Ste14
MKEIVFFGVVASLLLSNALLIVSIARPELRFWPPPDPPSRRHRFARFTSALGPLSLIGVGVLGVLDAGSAVFRHPAALPIGGLLGAVGGAFALWGYLGLGARASQGQHEGLVAAGAYRYSRNPQYVGTIVGLFGYGVACNSWLALVVWALWAAWFLMAPFAEEPWLREQLGDAFDEYAADVPRFIGWRRARDPGKRGAGEE